MTASSGSFWRHGFGGATTGGHCFPDMANAQYLRTLSSLRFCQHQLAMLHQFQQWDAFRSNSINTLGQCHHSNLHINDPESNYHREGAPPQTSWFEQSRRIKGSYRKDASTPGHGRYTTLESQSRQLVIRRHCVMSSQSSWDDVIKPIDLSIRSRNAKQTTNNKGITA